ncbi:transposase [Thermodesulfobacterium thermophilum]|uniref:transposase n=1 Tax=Thermodesulfobacterium thermophilum TaxID=886 RepID=UPI0003B5CB8C|nr:transposase [Thermodesulfobacterium thermophilum]
MKDLKEILNRKTFPINSPASISRLIEVATQKIDKWRNREVEEEVLRRGGVSKEPVYVVVFVGLTCEGRREILGFWVFGFLGFWVFGSEGESAINWREVLVELKGRGLKRVEVVIGDGLRGLKEAEKLPHNREEVRQRLMKFKERWFK